VTHLATFADSMYFLLAVGVVAVIVDAWISPDKPSL
jgi:hypothetical protein